MSFSLFDSSGHQLFRKELKPEDFETTGLKEDIAAWESELASHKSVEWMLDNIRVLYSESKFKKQAILKWHADNDVITMHFNLRGNMTITELRSGLAMSIGSNQHNIFYGQEAGGEIRFEENETQLLLIQMPSETFLKLAEKSNEAIAKFAAMVSERKPAALSPISLPIDYYISNCIASFLNYNYSPGLKRLYLYSKILELMVLQAASYDRYYQQPAGKIVIKSDYDRERILYARDYLINNLDAPPSLTELALIAGINEFKLKKGFKEVFSKSVFQYLADTRLDLAEQEILSRQKSVTQIAFELGYASVQHFSAAFKKKYGKSPGKI